MKRAIPILLLLAVAAAAWFFYPVWFPEEETDGRLMVSGNIEASETVLSFKIAGRIEELLVEEGEWVEVGQVIARLDGSDYRQQVELDRANQRVALAQLDLARAGARPQELEAASQTVREAEAELEQRQLDSERAESLYQKDAGSKQARDQTATALRRTQASLRRARQIHNQLQEGVRKEEIAIARANAGRAREVLEFSRIRLGQTELVAPTSGVVLVKQASTGEVVAPGSPVVTLGDLENVWLRAYIAETDLGRIRWGQPVELTTDTYPGKIYPGRISFISSKAEFTPKTIETHQERVKLVYRIKIAVENPNQELKPGMPADGVIKARTDDSGETQPEKNGAEQEP